MGGHRLSPERLQWLLDVDAQTVEVQQFLQAILQELMEAREARESDLPRLMGEVDALAEGYSDF